MPIYTSRQLLDPAMLQSLSNEAANRLKYETELNKAMGGSVRDMLMLGGKTIKDIREQKEFENELGSKWDISPEDLNDPVFRAAYAEAKRTRSSQPLVSYKMQKEASKARAEEAKRRAEDSEKEKRWHEAVRIAQARPEYAKTQKAMFDAADSGDIEMANVYKKQLEAYETEFGNVFGDSAESALEARKKAKILADEKKAAEKAEQEEIELGERNLKAIQEVNENERLHRVALFKNSLPTTFAKETDKQSVYDEIEANEDMTIPEKTKLMDEIRGIESGLTQTKKSKQSARASAAGEEVKEQIKISKETKKKADEAKKALESGYKLTADEQDAYDAVYGGK